MVGFGMTKLGVAVRTDVRPVAGLARILDLVAALSFSIARVPLGARRAIFWLLLGVVLLPLYLWLGDSLDGLHHAGGVHLGPDAGPGNGTIV